MRRIRSARRALFRQARRRSGPVPVGRANLGDLRRVEPISDRWGFDRGVPIDRYYIEAFLDRHRTDVRGRVLEVANDLYARQFGHDLERVDVLHVTEGNPQATIVADLVDAPVIDDSSFDCVILMQTLQFIGDPRAAIATVGRILAPRGVLLATVPGISKVSPYDEERWGDHWRFTTRSARDLIEGVFPASEVAIESHGNVLAATAFLFGLAAEELTAAELDVPDPAFPVTIALRAVKGLRGE